MVALFAAVIPLAHADAFVMCVFIVVIAVAWFGAKAAPLTLVFTALAVVLPAAVPSWHQSYATSLDNGNAIAIPMVALAMFGFFNVLHGNRALAEARSEIARLAAENERTRIARDLHDLLGHSLTTITVKAELSRRLGQTDVAAALREIGEVEVLSRRALSDVRAAVANYRDVTLVGELASGRELLRAAGIAADLPRAVDVVDDGAQELFGWVLREGLTNVVRHSHASLCTVRISKTSVEIVDDGSGMLVAAGSGLSGLRERVGAAGGTMEVGPVPPRGWRIAVRLSGADAGHLA
jgi:two-component system sensor histidine kinase DesK